jgi:hypothetical protein
VDVVVVPIWVQLVPLERERIIDLPETPTPSLVNAPLMVAVPDLLTEEGLKVIVNAV